MSNNNTITTTDPENDKKCAVCKISAKQACSGCKIVYYCNREHQKSDWKSHSKNCRLFKLADDPILGRHYAAARNIEAGEIVVYEKKPLLAVPSTANPPCCLNCYLPLSLGHVRRCGHCGWPLCTQCTRHGAECELTMKYRKSKVKIDNYTQINPIYEAILVMRAIAMRNTDPKAYKKLMHLEDHCAEASIETNTLIPPPREVAVLVKNFMKIHDLTIKEIAKIIGIHRVNGFGILTSSRDYHSGIFEKASYVSHSCRPNCRSVILNDNANEGNILVRAVTTIPEGHPITLTYTDPFRGTEHRRIVLRKTKFFDCACERCSDPTEFATMFNAIKCFNEKCDGYMLPPTFLVSAKEKVPDYVCDKCKAKRSSEELGMMLNMISSTLSQIAAGGVYQLKKFIGKNSMILHKNHHHIFNAEYKLAMIIGPDNFNLASASEECLKDNIKLCKKVDFLLQKLVPGEIESRGKVLFNEYSNITKLANTVENSSESRRLLKESKDVLSEIYQMFRQEPKDQEEGKMAEWARERMENSILKNL